jgi:putative transposase
LPLQKFAFVHASLHNHFNQDRHLHTRDIFKQNRSAALAEWRQLAAWGRVHHDLRIPVRFSLTLPAIEMPETMSALPLPPQPVDATQALNLSAGVSNSNVLRGRSFS